MKKRSVLGLIMIGFIFMFLVAGCSDTATDGEAVTEENYVPVEVRSVQKENLADSLSFNGRVHANEEVMVMPQMPGEVSQLNVRLGDYVTKGSVLFVMDQDDMQRNVEQAEQGVNSAQQAVNAAERSVDQAENGIRSAEIQYETTKEQVENALLNLERTKELYEAGAVPKSQLEQAEMQASTKPLEAAEAQIKQAEISHQQAITQLNQAKSGYEQAKSSYQQVRSGLNNTLVKAPVSGVVSTLDVVAGQLASNAQPAATIVDMSQVYLQVNVTENVINSFARGQEVTVNIPSALEETVTGTIDHISPTVDQRTGLYLVKVYVDNAEGKIRPGMSGSILLDINNREDVLVISRDAVIDRDDEMIVYVVEDDRAIERKVSLGLDTGSYVEITEGLEEGDVVILKGQHYVIDGQRVKVVRGE